MHCLGARLQGEIRHHRPGSTKLADAVKCILASFDSTMRSNLSVGMPIDLICRRSVRTASPRFSTARSVAPTSACCTTRHARGRCRRPHAGSRHSPNRHPNCACAELSLPGKERRTDLGAAPLLSSRPVCRHRTRAGVRTGATAVAGGSCARPSSRRCRRHAPSSVIPSP